MTPTEPLAATLSAIVGERAPQWFPTATAMEPMLAQIHRRTASSLYLFRLSADHSVLIKVQGVHPDAAASRPRPRVVPRPGVKHLHEAEALRAATEHFALLGDPHFRSVRLLDVLDDLSATVMEYLPWPSLRSLYLKAAVTRYVSASTRAAFATTGRWLSSYHTSQPASGATPRDHRLADYLESLDRLSNHILGLERHSRILEDVCARARQTAVTALPDELPLSTSHGDFSPANILVDRQGTIAVVDLGGRWLSPGHEDVAFFLTSLDTSRAALLTMGLARSRRVARSLGGTFLESYHGGSHSVALSLYRLNAMLDVWGSRLRKMPRWQWPVVNATFHALLREVDESL